MVNWEIIGLYGIDTRALKNFRSNGSMKVYYPEDKTVESCFELLNETQKWRG